MPRNGAADDTKTMRPDLCLRIEGATSWVRRNGATAIASSASRKSSMPRFGERRAQRRIGVVVDQRVDLAMPLQRQLDQGRGIG